VGVQVWLRDVRDVGLLSVLHFGPVLVCEKAVLLDIREGESQIRLEDEDLREQVSSRLVDLARPGDLALDYLIFNRLGHVFVLKGDASSNHFAKEDAKAPDVSL